MATFTDAQVTSIAVMFGTNSDLMGEHLEFFAGVISEDDKTEILAQVTRYTAGTMSGTIWIEARDRNFGVNTSPIFSAATRDPRAVVAGLIQWPYHASGGQTMLVRG